MFDDGPAVMLGVAVPAGLEAGVGAALGGVVESGSGWSALAPSGLLLDVLAGLTPESLDAGGVLGAAAAADRVVSFAQAVQVRLLARFAALRPADDDAGGGQAGGGQSGGLRDGGGGRAFSEFAADEVGPVLGVSRNTAAARLSLACDLTGRLDGTLAALERGEVDLVKARAVSEGVASLSDEQAAAVEARVLPRAGGQTAAQLRAAVKRAVLRVDPAAAQRREAGARADRRVVVTPAADGMAELWALLPAAEAVAVYDRVDRLARSCPGDGRTVDQRRADCFTDLLLDGAQGSAVRARVNVTVAASTLAGLDEEPGDLVGYGPVTAATARQLAAGALAGDTRWRRLLTDPVDGRVLDVGRRCYRPPAALADLVRARDRFCRFPGCRVPADRCDLDHTTRYPEGPTSVINLGSACRHHHRLKHETPGG